MTCNRSRSTRLPILFGFFSHIEQNMEIEIESLSSSLEQNFFSFFLPLLGVIDHKHPSRLHIIGIWYGHSCSVMYTVYTYNGKLPKQKSIEFHAYQWLWYPTLYSIRKLCPGNFISDHIILWCQNFYKYLPVVFLDNIKHLKHIGKITKWNFIIINCGCKIKYLANSWHCIQQFSSLP